MKMKRVCAGVLAGVVAASAVVMPVEPVFVYAEDLSPAVDAFIQSLNEWSYNTEVSIIYDSDGDRVYYIPIGFIRSYIENVKNAYAANAEINITGTQGLCYYRLVGSSTVYPCNVYAYSTPSGVLASSQHFHISYNFTALSSGADLNMYGVFNAPYYQIGGSASSGYVLAEWRDDLGFFTGAPSAQERAPYGLQISASVGTTIPTLSAGVGLGYVNTVGGANTNIVFPTGTVSKAEPWGYFNDTLVPYLQETYPDIPPEYLPPVYVPDTPYEPIYPTDFVTGVPKDWTITNPQLPSIPDLDFQIPTADFESLDVSPIRQNLSGVGFWWDLLETVLDTTAFKGLFLAFAIIGLAIFVLWKLGA